MAGLGLGTKSTCRVREKIMFVRKTAFTVSTDMAGKSQGLLQCRAYCPGHLLACNSTTISLHLPTRQPGQNL